MLVLDMVAMDVFEADNGQLAGDALTKRRLWRG